MASTTLESSINKQTTHTSNVCHLFSTVHNNTSNRPKGAGSEDITSAFCCKGQTCEQNPTSFNEKLYMLSNASKSNQKIFTTTALDILHEQYNKVKNLI
jgi:hypothetical protein